MAFLVDAVLTHSHEMNLSRFIKELTTAMIDEGTNASKNSNISPRIPPSLLWRILEVSFFSVLHRFKTPQRECSHDFEEHFPSSSGVSGSITITEVAFVGCLGDFGRCLASMKPLHWGNYRTHAMSSRILDNIRDASASKAKIRIIFRSKRSEMKFHTLFPADTLLTLVNVIQQLLGWRILRSSKFNLTLIRI